MRIIGCINAYQDAELLPSAVKSLDCVADRVIVVDGAYRDFPRYDEATWASTDGTQEAARGLGADVIEAPADGWESEIVKRNTYVDACRDGDWLIVLDADERVVFDSEPEEVEEWDRDAMVNRVDWMVRHYRLEAYEMKRAGYANHMSAEDADSLAMEQATMVLHRCFAWRHGLRYHGTHHALHVGDALIHPTTLEREGKESVLPRLRIEHVQVKRDPVRTIRKQRYYERLRASEAEYRLVHSL